MLVQVWVLLIPVKQNISAIAYNGVLDNEVLPTWQQCGEGSCMHVMVRCQLTFGHIV